jgi:acetyltransferase-like isoleucine patch superfamily enzyme
MSAHVDLTGSVTVGSRVMFGTHAAVIPGRQIGDDALIGAGSAVIRNVPAGVTVMGVPAKRIL